MAKTMAKLNGGIVENILWCSDWQDETSTLKDCRDYPVMIGDTFEGGRFYRNGERIMSAEEQLSEMRQALNILGVSE